ncbi:TetR/AcrR family transcriptional regulator [Paenibacillus antri]|uniref:TetR/AcrR family transcriptional regulator n=2 Tax=Paenibacillus antri TaxID=2582848 RepID=A0A5R9G983_9BACL|nr:TetR/AcrR family transcriptional regulator [Paenibacillus antri]
MPLPLPLREIKKARAKIALYEASLDLIGSASFRAVKLEDICAKAEVSKVTFFKFFPQKEDVLVYFMCVWLLERRLEIEEAGLTGEGAIRHVVGRVADGARTRPGLMLSLIGFLAESQMHPCMPVLSDAELHLLFPGREERARSMSVNLFALFHQWIEEAKAAGECVRAEPTPVLTQWMITVFYGAYLTAHMCRQDIMETYDLHLSTIFRTKE